MKYFLNIDQEVFDYLKLDIMKLPHYGKIQGWEFDDLEIDYKT